MLRRRARRRIDERRRVDERRARADATAADVDESEEFGGPLFPDEPVEDDVGIGNGRAPTTPAQRAACASAPTTPVRCRTGPTRRPARSPASARRRRAPRRRRRRRRRRRVVVVHHRVAGVARRRAVTTVMDQVQATRPSGVVDRSGGRRRRSERGYDRPGRRTGSGEFDLPSPTTDATSGYGSSTGEVPIVGPSRRPQRRGPARAREPGRITIGTDPSGMPRRPTDPMRRRPAPAALRPTGRADPDRQPRRPRNLPAAVVAGLVLAAVFIVALL